MNSEKGLALLGTTGLLAGCAVLLLVPTSAVAQEPNVLQEACQDCRILVDTVAVLGDHDGPGRLDHQTYEIEVDGQGRYYVVGEPGTIIQVFSADGEFLRTMGREGAGPGEFRWARALHVAEDGHVRIADRMNARLTSIAPEGEVETTSLQEVLPGFDLFSLGGDSILLGGYSFAPGIVGYSAHVFSPEPEGERIRSFGQPPHAITSQSEVEHVRPLALEREGGLWIASMDRYLVEHWSLEGERLRSYVREVDWFDDPAPPRALLPSIRQDGDGLLWVKILVPDPDEEEHDTVIEALDPGADEVLASRRLPGRYSNLFHGSRLARVVLDLEREVVQLVVLQMRLEDLQR